MKKKIIFSVLFLGVGFLFYKKVLPLLSKKDSTLNKGGLSKNESDKIVEAEYKEYEVKEWKDPNKLTRREYIDKYY
jgi:hypothetical protein|tara:strand:+ start:3948 stop:4175 length:228 start_codon:yes stop_codon:yes gene_type:complete